ncbi:hypothetical protein SDRG_04379 [Saprolegnia diclina VS20]|uniref:Uncharacterized protein n=1 Tax=Saprolegnia diclina (strain VS20) TaxID=1156394 RepID=T0S141_SAPDV|nr:hypothetical protein SDRG_04379 [Saprolegnia diclina VS20]EQC38683.1 hypothetical protein SDRG_04379 [Saprolegnia diclina VS20]|eukprot:XP_008608275.1 hypothetical protein SDRG_04379 [Saprolegnia diclina VS20]
MAAASGQFGLVFAGDRSMVKRDERTIMTACISPINVKHTSIFDDKKAPDSLAFHRKVAPPDSIAVHRKHQAPPPDSMAKYQYTPPSETRRPPDSLAGHQQGRPAAASYASSRRNWLFDYQSTASSQAYGSDAHSFTPMSAYDDDDGHRMPKAYPMYMAPNSTDDIRLHQYRSKHVRLDQTHSASDIQQRYALLRRTATFEEKLSTAMSRIPRDLRGAPKKANPASTKRVQFLDEYVVDAPPTRGRVRRSSC